MENNITLVLEKFEKLVKEGKTTSFSVSVRKHGLLIQVPQNALEQTVLLEQDMFDSLCTFFYGVNEIEYKSHDYTNLKSFVNARLMLNRLLNR